MAISDATLDTDIYSEVRSVIVSANPKVTNSATGDTISAGIESVYNDKKQNKPQIILNPIEDSEDTFRFGSSEGKKLINVLVDCYFTRSDGVDQLAQQVKDAVKNYEFSGIELVGVETNMAYNTNSESKLHLKSVNFVFDRE